jgi:hypothetical protein
MSDGICSARLDVHARATAAAAVGLGSGEVWKARAPGSPQAAPRSHSLGTTMVQDRAAGVARQVRGHVWSLPRILG